MRSFLLKGGKYAELKLEEEKVPGTLIIPRGIQREKNKMLLKINLLQENLPMKVKLMGIMKNKKITYIYF
jgi:hypothetical protein